MEEQLDAFATQLAELVAAPAEVWNVMALPVAVAVNALNQAAGRVDAPLAQATDHPVLLARQFAAAMASRRSFALAG